MSQASRQAAATVVAPLAASPFMAKTTSKARTAYVCSECGADYAKWQGQCEACGAWNTLAEIALETAA